LPHVAAFDVIHDEEELTLLYAELVNRNDVAVIEIDRNLRFVFEHVDEFRAVGVLRENALHRKELAYASGARSARKKHLGHPTGGEFLQKHILTKCLIC